MGCKGPLRGEILSDGSALVRDGCGRSTRLSRELVAAYAIDRANSALSGNQDITLLDQCAGRPMRAVAAELIVALDGPGLGGVGSHGKWATPQGVFGDLQLAAHHSTDGAGAPVDGYIQAEIAHVEDVGSGWSVVASLPVTLGVIRLAWTKIGNGLTVHGLLVVWGCPL